MAERVTLPEEVYEVAGSVAYAVWRRFKKFISREDLQQEALLWATRRVDDITRTLAIEDPEERRRAERRLWWQMSRHCEQQARKEKATQSGYQTRDEAFYETGTISQLLPFAIASLLDGKPLEAIQDIVVDGTPRKPASPSEGGTLLVMLIDIKEAYSKLDDDDRWLLAARYHHDYTLKQIADELGTAISTADRRCERALAHLQDQLGGKTPW